MTSYHGALSATTGTSSAGPANPFTLDEAGVRCPYAHYEAVRAKGPVVWSPELDAWLITAYDDIEQVLRQPGLASSRTPTGPHVPEQISKAVARSRAAGLLPERVERFLANPPDPTVFTIDPPDHTRQRRTVQRMFTPADVARWEPWAREIATDAVVDMVAAGEVDVASGFAHRLALGLSVRVVGLEVTERDRMQRWSDEVVGVIGNAGARRGVPGPSRAAAGPDQRRSPPVLRPGDPPVPRRAGRPDGSPRRARVSPRRGRLGRTAS